VGLRSFTLLLAAAALAALPAVPLPGCATSTPTDGAGSACTRDRDCTPLSCVAGVCSFADAATPDAASGGDAAAADARGVD
jgi:hypothetical protein